MRPAALLALLFLLTGLAGLPLLAPVLPGGPASVAGPGGAAVGAGGLLVLFALFAWPPLQSTREPREIAASGLALLGIGLPFLTVLGLSHGTDPAAILRAGVVVGGAVVATGSWLSLRPVRADRHHAAFWVAVTAGLPLANYVLSDFLGSSITAGYRVSPLLAVRRIVLMRPDSDPLPFLLVAVAFLAVASASRILARSAVVLLLVGLSGIAAAGSVTPVLGDRYVPGRPVALLVTAEDASRDVAVSVPGRTTTVVSARAGGALVAVPGPEELPVVLVNGKPVKTGLRPAPRGRLVAVTGPIGAALRAAAREAGLVLTRADRAAELEPALLLGVDAVMAPDDALPTVSADGIRRPWEEPDRVFLEDGLFELFPPAVEIDRSRERRAFAILLLFAAVAAALLRFGGRRGLPSGRTALLLLVPAAAAVLAGGSLLPPPEHLHRQEIHVLGGGRDVTLTRLTADRPVTAELETVPFPLLLGRTATGTVTREGGTWILRTELGAGESRLFVTEESGPAPGPGGELDLVVGREGLRRPGEAPVPAGEYLAAARRRGEEDRAALLRKLVVLRPPAGVRYGIRFAGRARLEIFALAE